jgi:hypothetical protein
MDVDSIFNGFMAGVPVVTGLCLSNFDMVGKVD